MRPCLLLVDGLLGTFTDHVLSRDDLDLVLLRFEEHLSSLPADHLLRTADIPTFTIAADADIWREAERYLTWVAGLPARPAHFCNPQEPLQEISQRFAGLRWPAAPRRRAGRLGPGQDRNEAAVPGNRHPLCGVR